MNMMCPACKLREDGLINPDCPICDGNGTLPLGDAATNYYEPATVAKAITLSLEARAREIDNTTTLEDDRTTGLTEHTTLLHKAGLIGNRHTKKGLPKGKRGPVELAEAAAQTPITGLDQTLISATHYRYGPRDRPLERGLPPYSQDGHPSQLARLTNPYDLFTDNVDHHNAREARDYHARELAEAAPEAARQYTNKENTR